MNRGPGAQPSNSPGELLMDIEDVQDTIHFGSRKKDILERKMVRSDELERRNEVSLLDM